MPSQPKNPEHGPLTSTERVRALRKRRAESGMAELRDVWVPADRVADAKAMVREWLKALEWKG